MLPTMKTAINVSMSQVLAHVVYDILKIEHYMLHYRINLLPEIVESLPQLTVLISCF